MRSNQFKYLRRSNCLSQQGFLYSLLMMQLFLSCGIEQSPEADESIPIASIGNVILFDSDLKDRIPKGLSVEDSTRFSQSVVNNWMRDQLWIQQAKIRLSRSDRDVEKEVETYRNSLLIYRYQQQLLKQRLDTTVIESEILDYYQQNEMFFKLDEPIVQATYVKVLNTSPDIDKLQQWIRSNRQEDFLELEAYCFRYASKYDNFNEEWVRLYPILSRFPNTVNIEKTIKSTNGWHDSSDSLYYRCLFIKKIRLKNQKAPLNFVRDRIENLILNNRKQELVKTIEYGLHEEARNNGSYKLYN